MKRASMMEDAIFSAFLVDLIIIFLILLLILCFFNFEEKMFWSFIIIYEKTTPCS
jgi:hypothetical protein